MLVVADDPLGREIYGELFRLRGYHVTEARSAREGLRLGHDPRLRIAVIALSTGGACLRQRLLALRPGLRVHLCGLPPLGFEPARRAQLH